MDLDLVEVEWADEDGGGLRKSVLGAAARVAFESVLPVRRFASYRGQRHFTGWYWAATTVSLVGFGEGTVELPEQAAFYRLVNNVACPSRCRPRTTSSCCPPSGGPSTTTASRSATAPTTARSSTGSAGSPPG